MAAAEAAAGGPKAGAAGGGGQALQRPYTHGTFQKRLDDFAELIGELTLRDVEATPEERRQMITENLRYDQFCDSIRALFGADVNNQDLKAMYRKISTNPDAHVDWSELFGYFQSEHEEAEAVVGEEVSVFTVPARRRVGDAAGDRKRRDIIVNVRYVGGLDCYMTASQKGAVSLWSNKLRLQTCSEINEAAWVTGVDYLPTIRRVVVCTERSICIWDNRAKGKNQYPGATDKKPMKQVFSIKPIEDSPQCVCWIPAPGGGGQAPHEDTILFGDDQGYINLLTIAAKDLTVKGAGKGGGAGAAAQKQAAFTQNHTLLPQNLSYPIKRRRLHNDWVVRVKYFPELRCFASCSPSGSKSFVLEETERLVDDGEVRGVAIPKGVNAFDYCVRANIIATGGVDKIIRVWHPHIFSRPTGKLIGHLFTIVDITVNEKDQHIISLSTARVFRIWDIHTLTSLQVFTDNEERPGEKRIYSILFDNKHDRLLSGSSVLDVWPLTRSVQDTMAVPQTHDRPIAHLRYNPELNQVVSVCTESVVKVWAAETGRLVYSLPDAHGAGVEVTALTIDKTGYRMATGGHDGSLKVWDMGSGQDLKTREGRGAHAVAAGEDGEHAIVGLYYCMAGADRCLVVAGPGNALLLLQDSNETNDLPVLRQFYDVHYVSRPSEGTPRGSSFSKHAVLPDITPRGSPAGGSSAPGFSKEHVLSRYDVTCVDAHLPEHLLVTGTASGDIVFWDLPDATVNRVLRLPPQSEGQKSAAGDGAGGAAGLRRALSGGELGSAGRAVTALAFLTHRRRTLITKRRKGQSIDYSPPNGDSDQKTPRSAKATDIELDGAVLADLPKVEEAADAATTAPAETDRTEPQTTGREEAAAGEVPSDDVTKDGAGGADEQTTEKPEKHARIAADDDEEDEDPENNYTVEEFAPVLASCHADSYIRFWDLEGTLLLAVSAVTRRGQGTPVTALTHDADCGLLLTGDTKGYLTLWDVADFLSAPAGTDAADRAAPRQALCWRAHLGRVVALQAVPTTGAWLSAAVDGSVRIWWGVKGRFVGFFGQQRPLVVPTSESTAGGPATLPYDITEPPLAPTKVVSARQKIRAQQKFEYPLVFNNKKWEPFRRSAYMREKQEPPKHEDPTDKKFFAALIKPRLDNSHLESYNRADWKTGAVFRALPVYRVRTPMKPRTPVFSFPTPEEADLNPILFGLAAASKNKLKKAVRVVAPATTLTVPPAAAGTTSAAATALGTPRTTHSTTATGTPRKR